MKWYWIIPICFAIIGYFGIFWTVNLANMEFDIKMDNNTLQSVQELMNTSLKIQEIQYKQQLYYCNLTDIMQNRTK